MRSRATSAPRKDNTVRTLNLSALAIALVASGLFVSDVRTQGQKPAPVFTPTTGDYEKADIRVLTPGVVFMSGLPDLAAEFGKETARPSASTPSAWAPSSRRWGSGRRRPT